MECRPRRKIVVLNQEWQGQKSNLKARIIGEDQSLLQHVLNVKMELECSNHSLLIALSFCYQLENTHLACNPKHILVKSPCQKAPLRTYLKSSSFRERKLRDHLPRQAISACRTTPSEFLLHSIKLHSQTSHVSSKLCIPHDFVSSFCFKSCFINAHKLSQNS